MRTFLHAYCPGVGDPNIHLGLAQPVGSRLHALSGLSVCVCQAWVFALRNGHPSSKVDCSHFLVCLSVCVCLSSLGLA